MSANTKQNKEYWRDRKINWVSHYWNPEHQHRSMIVDMLKGYPVRKVLEIGCGCGANLYRIKKAIPDVKIAGCDISKDAIRTARKQFGLEQEEIDFDNELPIRDIELRVGSADNLPFHGDSFDLVITDALLIYIGPEKIKRVLREIRRVGYEKVMFVEFHSENFFKRLGLRSLSRYYAYNYKKLLAEQNFKYIKIRKIPEEVWGGKLWTNFGYVITAIR